MLSTNNSDSSFQPWNIKTHEAVQFPKVREQHTSFETGFQYWMVLDSHAKGGDTASVIMLPKWQTMPLQWTKGSTRAVSDRRWDLRHYSFTSSFHLLPVEGKKSFSLPPCPPSPWWPILPFYKGNRTQTSCKEMSSCAEIGPANMPKLGHLFWPKLQAKE